MRVVEYGATKYGFAPAGEGITVPPPTLVDENSRLEEEEEYPNQYYDAPAPRPAPINRPIARPAPRPRPRPQPQYESFSPPQQFAPAPVPQRANIPGAVPSSFTSNLDFGPKARASIKSYAPVPAPLRPAPQNIPFQPAPIEESQDEYEPAPRPAPRPKITYAHPTPLRPAPPPDNYPIAAAPSRPVPRPQFAAPKSNVIPRPGGGGVLDQLAKDYALPQDGAAPLHDISFGYY